MLPKQAISLFILIVLLSGCVSMKESTAISGSVSNVRIKVVDSLPQELPSKSSTIEHSLYVMILSDSAAKMLVPVPFVGDMALSAVNQDIADSYEEKYKGRYISINPYTITLDAVKDNDLFQAEYAGYTLHPFVFVTESVDDKYRASLVYHVESEDWVGRYLYHLPTAVPIEEAENPTPEKIAAFREELITGAGVLVGLIERDAHGELGSTGTKVDFGSLHIVGSNIAGLISPEIMHSKNAELIEQGDDYVILRNEGDMEVEGQAGALFFGVHYFRNDLLHTFKILPAPS